MPGQPSPASPSISQGSAGPDDIAPTDATPTLVPAPKPGFRHVQVPITAPGIVFDEDHGTDITQKRRDGKGNWRYKAGQPQRALMRATAAASALPGSRAFSFGCTCGME